MDGVRREASEVRDQVYAAGRQVRTAGGVGAEHLGKAGTRLREAGEASVDLAREATQLVAARATDAADDARERVGDLVEKTQEKVADTAVDLGRKAVEMTVQVLTLPVRVRQRVRRSREAVEEAGTRVVSSVLHTGSKVLDAAADYVAELTPRRRVRRAALERLLVEQLAWARQGVQLLDRAAAESDDDGSRIRIVRGKLHFVRQEELLTLAIRAIGASVPSESKLPDVAALEATSDGARPVFAAALSVAEQSATTWQAIAQIAAAAESDVVAEALIGAAESAGAEPSELVVFLRERLVHQTVESVLT